MPGARWLRGLAQRAVHQAWRAVRDAGAVTADSPAGRRFAAFGPGSVLVFPLGAIFGEPWIEIGADTLAGQQVTISAGILPGQELGPATLLRIGDRCVIGRGTHIVAHQRIDIGDDVFTGPYVYITDQNHGYTDPETPIGRQWPANSPVSIGAGSWLGAGAIVLPGSCIGRNVVVGAGSVVRGQVPDHCVVAGVPARVIRSYVPGDGWRPASPSWQPTGPDWAPASAGPAAARSGPEASAGPAEGLADPEGVQGVPEPPHPVL